MLGVTNLLTPLSYANAADVENYDSATNPISTAKSFSFLMPAHHVYLYATTEANHYFVDYNPGTGGTWSMEPDEFIFDTNTWHLSENQFVKTWYTWSSWNTGADGKGTDYSVEDPVHNWTTDNEGRVPVYAQWTANGYAIAYDLNQGSGSSVPVQGASHPESATYDSGFTVSNPSRTWYSFSGWHITGMDTAYPHEVGWTNVSATEADGITWTSFNNLRATSGTVHFAAKWNPDQVTYVVRHFKEELDGSRPATPTDIYTGSATADEYLTWATTWYVWFDTPTAVSQRISPEGNTVFEYDYPRKSYNLELIAGRWVKDVTVASTSYSSGGTNSGTHTYSFKYDDQVTLSFGLAPWYQTGTWSGYKDDDASFNMPAEHISKTAYADLITYDLIIHPTWGSGAISTRTYNVEDENIPLGNPERDHSTFEWWTGWVINGTQLDWPTKNVVVTSWSIGDREYTATWSCDSWYHIEYTWQNNEACMADKNTPYTVEHYQQNLENNEYTKVDTDYLSWETDEDTQAEAKPYEGFTVSGFDQEKIKWDKSTVIKIYYNRNSYDKTITTTTWVTVDTTAANSPSGWPYKYEDTVTLTPHVQSWYTFESWTVTADSWSTPVTVSGNTFEMPASDVTIKANVTTNKYHVSIDKNWWEGGTNSGYEYTVEDKVDLDNPERDHSIFVWWSWTDLTKVTHDVSFSGRAYDSSYEAVWDCVTWYHDSGTGQSCVNNTYTVNIDYNYHGDQHWAATTKDFTYDVTWDIANPEESWYTFVWWTISWMTAWIDHYVWGTTTSETDASGVMGTEFKNLATTGDEVTFVAQWEPKTDTPYVVEHYYENVDGTYTHSWTDNLSWVTDEPVVFDEIVKNVVGYTGAAMYLSWNDNGPIGDAQTVIKIDKYGHTHIYIYYTRNTFHVYLSGDAHITNLTGAGDYRYGETVTVTGTVEPWYHFKHWEKRWTGFAKIGSWS